MALVRMTYFNVRGRAEPIRLMLELAGVKYEQPSITLENWPSLKTNYPFGQLPLYEELPAEGAEPTLKIPQSHAIYRYLARKHNLYGKSEEDHIRCDVIEEAFTDYILEIGKQFWDKEWQSKKEAFDTKTLPSQLRNLDVLWKQNPQRDSLHWVGNYLTVADVFMWFFFDTVRPFTPNALQDYPEFQSFKKKFEELPAIADYLKSERRPKTYTVSLAPFGGRPEEC